MTQYLDRSLPQQGNPLTALIQTGIQACSEYCVKIKKTQDRANEGNTQFFHSCITNMISCISNNQCIDCVKCYLDKAVSRCNPHEPYSVETACLWFLAIRKGRADVLELFISCVFFKNYKYFKYHEQNSVEHLFKYNDSISTEDFIKIFKLFSNSGLISFQFIQQYHKSSFYSYITESSKKQFVKKLLESCKNDIEICIENKLKKALEKLREECIKELIEIKLEQDILKLYIDILE